jgi:hypothetical protein
MILRSSHIATQAAARILTGKNRATLIGKNSSSLSSLASSFHSSMKVSPVTTAVTTLLYYSTTPSVALSSSNNMVTSKSVLSSLKLDNSWPRELSPETDQNFQKSIQIENLDPDTHNRTKRPVFNGHYVLVKPTGLKDPQRVILSKDVAYNLLNLSSEQVESNDFVQWVSGNLVMEETWGKIHCMFSS